jgi:hypothetical protein
MIPLYASALEHTELENVVQVFKMTTVSFFGIVDSVEQ